MIEFNINANFPVKKIELLTALLSENVSLAGGIENENYKKYQETKKNVINFFGLNEDDYECVWNSGATETINEIAISGKIKDIKIHKYNHAISSILINSVSEYDAFNSRIICPISPATGKICEIDLNENDIIDATQSIRYWNTPLLKKIREDTIRIKPFCIFSSCYKFGGMRGLGFVIYKKNKLNNFNTLIKSESIISPMRGGSIALPSIIHASEVLKEYKNINNFKEKHDKSHKFYDDIKLCLEKLHCEINEKESCELEESNYPYIIYDSCENPLFTYSTISFYLPFKERICAKEFIKLMEDKNISIGYITNCAANKTSILRISWDYETIEKKDIDYLIEALKATIYKILKDL